MDRYAHIVETISRNGMQPIVTLHHFTHPAWAGLDFWMHDEGPDLLAEYMLRVGGSLLSKPYRAADLVARVRTILDRG